VRPALPVLIPLIALMASAAMADAQTVPAPGPLAGPAPDRDWQQCTAETDDDDLLIKACAAVIRSGSRGDEDRAIAYKYLCLAYNDKGDHGHAIENCDAAIKLKPDFIDAYLFRGHAWFNTADYDRAIADYGQAIALGSHAATTFTERAAAFHRKGEEARAIEDLDQAVAIDPKDPTAFYVRAVCHEAQKENIQAIADYGEAIRLAPGFTVALYRRGVLRRAVGDAGGDADIALARRIDPRIGTTQGRQ
jgi:tetratricopeptide (TPR) repeat protein